MTDVEILDQSTAEDGLDELAGRIRDQYRRSRDALGEAIDAYMEIGHALSTARKLLVSDQAFGAWFNAQEFGFLKGWALTLRNAAENELAVREAVRSQLRTGNAPNIEKAVTSVLAPARTPRAVKPAPVDTRVDNPAPDIAEPVAATDDSAPPAVDTVPGVPASADAPFDAMRDAIRCADDSLHADLVAIITAASDPDGAAVAILALYDLTPRTETTP